MSRIVSFTAYKEQKTEQSNAEWLAEHCEITTATPDDADHAVLCLWVLQQIGGMWLQLRAGIPPRFLGVKYRLQDTRSYFSLCIPGLKHTRWAFMTGDFGSTEQPLPTDHEVEGAFLRHVDDLSRPGQPDKVLYAAIESLMNNTVTLLHMLPDWKLTGHTTVDDVLSIDFRSTAPWPAVNRVTLRFYHNTMQQHRKQIEQYLAAHPETVGQLLDGPTGE